MSPGIGTTSRVITAELAALERGERVRPRPYEPADATLRTIGSWGGSALGLALLLEQARDRPGEPAPLVLTAGACVRSGLPTAARLSVLSRSPQSGLLAEGQVGGEAGPRLARVADALLIQGRTDQEGAVLVIEANGAARLAPRPDLRGADPVTTWRALQEQHGSVAVLCIGRGGERGLPFANLARGGEQPSFVGRGGLGAVLGRMGLKAVVLASAPTDAPRDPVPPGFAALTRALASSPRLAERAAGGTMELYGAFAARGDLRGKSFDAPLAAGSGARLADEARSMGRSRSGCRGCPTPCGWVFERPDGVRMGAHFAATYSLGTNLGLDGLAPALELLALCDELGLDAKEVGALLALAARARETGRAPGPPLWGERARLAALVRDLVGDDPELEALRGGAGAFARAVGLEAEHAVSRGQSARPESNLAAVLGQCTSSAGADPMRSFPFLVESAGRAGLERLCADLSLPPRAEDPQSPAGKGRLVAWHEDLVSAVDATGFCTFSTAGLLADDLCDLDGLARWILPPALAQPDDSAWRARSPGERLLAAGANLVLVRRILNQLWGAPVDQDRPAWARPAIDAPGMLDEYLAVRGLDETGAPLPETLALLGQPETIDRARAALAARPVPVRPEPSSPPTKGDRSGVVELRALGSLGDALGRPRQVELPLPASALDVLRGAAGKDARLLRRLVRDGQAVPTIWRDGQLLAPETLVDSGDVLDLVTAISGG